MSRLFNKKLALFGLLILLSMAVLSCGQFSLGGLGGMLGTEIAECSILVSATSIFSSKDSLLLIGTLLLLVVLSAFVQRTFWKEKFYTLDLLEHAVALNFKQIKDIPNQMNEAFRKGIVHPQIYNSVTASD